jgi:hypothetical protein
MRIDKGIMHKRPYRSHLSYLTQSRGPPIGHLSEDCCGVEFEMLSAVDGRLDPMGQPAARALIKGLRSPAATCNATGLRGGRPSSFSGSHAQCWAGRVTLEWPVDSAWAVLIGKCVSPPQIHTMSYHRFKVGQTVVAPSGGPGAVIPRGPLVIVRLLPFVDGDAQYRVLSKIDGRERVVSERQIRPLVEER